MNEPSYEVVWPQSPRGVQRRRTAPRIAELSTATIGFLWDNLFRGDELFPLLRTELERRHPGVTIIGFEEFGNTHGVDELEMVSALPESLRTRGVDAVVSGMGC